MTSEYENGPELFDGNTMQENNAQEPKNGKKMVVKKITEASPTSKRRVKKETAVMNKEEFVKSRIL